MEVLGSELKEPSEANLSLLIGEVLKIELPVEYPKDGYLEVNTILHGETLSEFKPYEKKGWITITPNGNVMNMGANNMIGNSIEDKKRPLGLGSGFVITFNKSLYEQ